MRGYGRIRASAGKRFASELRPAIESCQSANDDIADICTIWYVAANHIAKVRPMACFVTRSVAIVLSMGLFSVAAPGSSSANDDPSAIPNEEVQLEALPNAPPGVVSAVLFGDLAKEGLYVLRNRWPAGAVLPPHNHGNATRIYTVLEGEVWWGFGHEIDEAKMVRLGPGGVAVTRPEMPPHYFRVGPEGAVINVVAEGPFVTNMDGP
jgi:hypothetical protein